VLGKQVLKDYDIDRITKVMSAYLCCSIKKERRVLKAKRRTAFRAASKMVGESFDQIRMSQNYVYLSYLVGLGFD
jgi:hypothetical protein